MEAFKGKYERTSMEQHDEFLKVFTFISNQGHFLYSGSWCKLLSKKGFYYLHTYDGDY